MIISMQAVRVKPFAWLATKKQKTEILCGVQEKFGNSPLIVRSSCHHEDKLALSNAGKFVSILDVNFDDLEVAVDKVIESYCGLAPEDEVLIQVEATPINPSDLGLLIGPGDINTLVAMDSKIIMDVPKAIAS